jgi:hypothetical protein
MSTKRKMTEQEINHIKEIEKDFYGYDKTAWKLTFSDIEYNFKDYSFTRTEFLKLIDKIDELTYSKKYIFLLHREDYGLDPFICKSANLIQWLIQNAPVWGSRGHYHLFCYESWEEAYDNALLLQERFDTCYKK